MSNAAPVQEPARVNAVDAARGFALLGIFCVNILLFAHPFGTFTQFEFKGPLSEQIAHAFVSIFCQGKFYSLFSLLFGIGFALQRGRVKESGGSWVQVYLRRIIFLGVVGALHATLLWYGDILFIYAAAALVLLACGACRARTLVIVAIALITISTLLGTVLAAVSYSQYHPPAPVEAAATVAEPAPAQTADDDAKTDERFTGPFFQTAFGRLIKGLSDRTIQDPAGEEWMGLEREVYQNGPFSQVVLFRLFNWIMILCVCLIGLGWSIVGMFFIGAALAKADAFSPANQRWHRRFVVVGFLVGLPLVAIGSISAGVSPSPWTVALQTLCQSVGSPLMSLGYLGAMTLLVESGKFRGLTGRLKSTGRMAMTNYLIQTVIATTLFYYYGFGLFDRTTRAQELGIVLAVYAIQLFVVSPLWMGAFRFGPMEWLWRSFTYWSPQPMRRAKG